MTIRQLIEIKSDASINWSSPNSPVGSDYSEAYMGIYPIPDDHAPSLTNPIKTKIPTAQDGWHRGDSKAARQQAYSDLAEIHKRLRRQIGKPEIAHTANYPVFPDITRSF